MGRSAVVRGLVAGATALLVVALGALQSAAPATAAPVPDEPYRPQLHFSPRANWINDPNGLVYANGRYHLYYQHNPSGTRWGNMSWGHAVSTDLLHWSEQPLAIPQTFDSEGRSVEDIFSGSVVYDRKNTSGLGTLEKPPMVAVYTSYYPPANPSLARIQAQSIAYSTDEGATWTKYSGNPVLNRGSENFRDPKVFRYTGSAGSYWVMVVVEALERKVLVYKSTNLKQWTYLSTFGPANSTGGVWECPDLFPLPVDGDPTRQKWVMVVNLNPGSVGGGSGAQYFVGSFDGTTFTSESTVTGDQRPTGRTVADFEDGGFDGWTVSNQDGDGPWGTAPTNGTLPGQQDVSGYVGSRLVNGFHGGDGPIGSLESAPFTLDQPYLDFLVGGGRHPAVPNSQFGNEPPDGRLLFDGFEYPDGTTLADAGWALTGDFQAARNPSTVGGEFYLGDKRLNTYEGGPDGDGNRGTLTSPEFTVDQPYLSFLLGGGRRSDGSLQVELVVDGKVVRTATGSDVGRLNWRSFDVAEFAGQRARLVIRDEATGGWGHLTFDHPVLGPAPARPRSEETTVNLVVDGKVVRTATGSDSEVLDWTNWDVRDLQGKTATLRLVDRNRWGWGHLLADHFVLSGSPAYSRLERYDWVDWGRDNYAVASFNDVLGRRVVIGWMNNWDYADAILTQAFRGSMTLPRELALVTTAKGPRLVQRPVRELDGLRGTPQTQLSRTTINGPRSLSAPGTPYEIQATFSPGYAQSFGLDVLAKGDSATRIGYDTAAGRLSLDRRRSGRTDFAANFASLEDAPAPLRNGRLTLRILVDRASVEVFAQSGRVALTDQVFPLDGADGLSVWSQGGPAVLENLTVTPLPSTNSTT